MATLPEVRDAVVVTLDAIPELHTFDVWPDQGPQPPCCIVMLGNPVIVYDDSFDGTGTGNITVKLFVGVGTSRSAQDKLDSYIMSGTDQSVKDALEGTLNGLVAWFTVKSCENYGEHTYADQSFMGADFACEFSF